MKAADIFAKVKGKWLYYVVALVILALCGYAASEALHRKEVVKKQPYAAQEVYLDILHLENSPDLKLSAAQAASMLPLVEKLSSGETIQAEDITNIYSLLTTQQYLSLLNINAKDRNNSDFRRDGHDERLRINDSKQEALKNITLNLLKERAGGNAAQ
ncbi:MAG: hypothetical protein ACOY31_01965 [Bacillota bacterium]